jgi:uncharacterized hydrophobic protein (TIGR00341 family)
MAIRLIEIYLPEKEKRHVKELLDKYTNIEIWQDRISEGKILTRILIPTEETESLLDELENRFGDTEGFRAIILQADASIPRIKLEERTKKEVEKKNRISREEVYAEVENTIKLSWNFVLLVLLSSLLIAIGMLENNFIIVIGGMVIAPLIGPNVALSLATTLGDMNLARRAVITNFLGIIVVVSFTCLMGLILDINPTTPELVSRTKVGLDNVLVALAAGIVAALSYTTRLSSALIGVMVAVALLPPMVAFGLLLGSRNLGMAMGAMMLLLINIISINLAGVTTFLAQGIRPLTWWEAEKARRATRVAIALWASLLLVLVVVILVSPKS